MFNKMKKIIIYAISLAMLIIAGYIIFIRNNMIKSTYYFIIVAIAFALACITLLFVILKGKLRDKKTIKTMIILVVILIVFQVVALPIANIFSQSFPVMPRGYIYQLPGLKNSIALNDVGLLMQYYLDGKILHAKADYPKEMHKGYLYITDEYEFVESDFKELTENEVQYIKDNTDFYTTKVQYNTKLEIGGNSIMIYIGSDYKDIKHFVLLTDVDNNWYIMPKSFYEEGLNE